MIDAATFKNTRLRGGLVIARVAFTDEPMLDALGREAIAKTGIIGMRFDLLIRAELDERELSVTLYHEILEAAAVASADPPASVMDFNGRISSEPLMRCTMNWARLRRRI